MPGEEQDATTLKRDRMDWYMRGPVYANNVTGLCFVG